MSRRSITLQFIDIDEHHGSNVDEPTMGKDRLIKRLTDRIEDMYEEGWVLSTATDEGALFAYTPEAARRVRRDD